jgi:hypothetical protein
MTYKYSFYQLSSDFSQEHADAHHEGKESENNVKIRWEDEILISEEATLKGLSEGSFLLQGETDNGPFKYDIPNMVLETYEADNGSTVIAISKSLILESKEEEIDGVLHKRIYMTDEDVIINPFPGLYVSVADFPEELK